MPDVSHHCLQYDRLLLRMLPTLVKKLRMLRVMCKGNAPLSVKEECVFGQAIKGGYGCVYVRLSSSTKSLVCVCNPGNANKQRAPRCMCVCTREIKGEYGCVYVGVCHFCMYMYQPARIFKIEDVFITLFDGVLHQAKVVARCTVTRCIINLIYSTHCIYITYRSSHYNWLVFIPLFQFGIMNMRTKFHLIMSSSFCFLLFWPP